MAKITRKRRKQLALDISKFNKKKITDNMRCLVDRALVHDRKGFYCPVELLKILSPSSFTTLLKLALQNKRRLNSIFFEPVVMAEMRGSKYTASLI